jgi:hypothetical protein
MYRRVLALRPASIAGGDSPRSKNLIGTPAQNLWKSVPVLPQRTIGETGHNSIDFNS